MSDLIGRSAIQQLHAQNGYVYHGSDKRLELIEPRQAFSVDKVSGMRDKDGEPAVCASADFELAIFRAVINRYRDEENGRPHYSGWSGSTNDWVFYTLRSSLEAAKNPATKGYVHVLDKELFTAYRGEMRAYTSVTPAHVVEVGYVDLPKNIQVFDSVQEIQDYSQTLQ